MAWIELHQALKKHPKTLQLASILGFQDPDHARVKVENLWLWALDYCPHGRLTVRSRHLSAAEIASASDFHGDATGWLTALIDSGFIDEVQGGIGGKTLQLHDWQQYGGKLHAAREAEAERGRQRRKGGRPADVRPASVGRGEESRGERRGDREEEREERPSPLLASPGTPERPAGEAGDVQGLKDQITAAYRRWDPTVPVWKCEAEIKRAQGLGIKLPELLAAVVKTAERLKLWTIIDNFQHPAARGNTAKLRENAPTEIAPILKERRDGNHQRQDEARKQADQRLAEMDPGELNDWTTEAEAAAAKAGIPQGPPRAMWIQAELRRRAAEAFQIEGV